MALGVVALHPYVQTLHALARANLVRYSLHSTGIVDYTIVVPGSGRGELSAFSAPAASEVEAAWRILEHFQGAHGCTIDALARRHGIGLTAAPAALADSHMVQQAPMDPPAKKDGDVPNKPTTGIATVLPTAGVSEPAAGVSEPVRIKRVTKTADDAALRVLLKKRIQRDEHFAVRSPSLKKKKATLTKKPKASAPGSFHGRRGDATDSASEGSAAAADAAAMRTPKGASEAVEASDAKKDVMYLIDHFTAMRVMRGAKPTLHNVRFTVKWTGYEDTTEEKISRLVEDLGAYDFVEVLEKSKNLPSFRARSGFADQVIALVKRKWRDQFSDESSSSSSSEDENDSSFSDSESSDDEDSDL